MSTIVDVARLAGVSKSTVSRVLTGGPVSEETRARVLAAMRELDYEPNAVARGLVSRRSKLIGVLISDVADPYYSELMQGMEDAASERRYDLLIYSTRWEEERELAYLRRLASRHVDGVIIVGGRSVTGSAFVRACRELVGEGRPLLFIDRGLGRGEVPVIEVDNVRAAKEATEHLIALGHRRIAHIAGPADVSAARQRTAGYRAALAAAGIPWDPALLVRGDFRKESGQAATQRLLSLERPPTAIFAGNDLMALGAWKAILEHGLRVPRDVALVGFDDVALLALAEVPLTTVRQPRHAMGRRAVELLIEQMGKADGASGRVVTLPTELVIRGSCGAGQPRDLWPLSELRVEPS